MSLPPQPTSWMPIYIALITAGTTLLGVFLGSYLTSQYSFKNQVRLSTNQARQHSYSDIMGKKVLLDQLLVSRFEALIHFQYHEQLWKRVGSPMPSIDLDEARRWMHKSEDLAIEIAKTKQSLYESLGIARASFTATEELNALSERIYHLQGISIKEPPSGHDTTALQAWQVKAVSDLQQFVQKEYSEPIDGLLEYLRQHMNDPVSY